MCSCMYKEVPSKTRRGSGRGAPHDRVSIHRVADVASLPLGRARP